MRYITSYRSCSALLLTILFAGWVQVHGHHRASHDSKFYGAITIYFSSSYHTFHPPTQNVKSIAAGRHRT